MPRTIRLQSDSNAHDRPWRVAVEQGFFKAEGLDVEYNEDNPKGVAGRVEHFSDRWMEPLVSRAAEAGCRQIAELRWRGGIVVGDDVDDETAQKLTRALNRAVEWLRENEERSRTELLRDLKPEQRKTGMLPELLGVQSYKPTEFQEKVDWMMDRGFLKDAPAYKDV